MYDNNNSLMNVSSKGELYGPPQDSENFWGSDMLCPVLSSFHLHPVLPITWDILPLILVYK